MSLIICRTWGEQPPALAPENDSQAWRLLYCGAVSPASLGAESRVPTGGALPVSFSRFGQGEAFNGTSSSRGWSYSSGAPWVGMSSRPFTVAALIGLSKPVSDMSNHTLIARGYGGAGIPFFVDVELSTPTYANPRLRIGTFNGSVNAIAWFDVNALTQGDALNVYGGWDGTNWVIWVNGVAGTSSSAFGPDADNAQPIAIGSLPGLGRYWTSSITAVGLSGRPPTAAAAAEFLSRPYDVLFAPRRIIIPVSAAGGGAITGTLTGTLGDLTASSTGALSIAGTASATLAALTSTATGALPIVGTLTKTLDALTLAATGSLAVSGTGTLTATLADATLSAAGALPITGTASKTLDALTSAATGTLPIAGTLTKALDAATLSASGVFGSVITGAASATLGSLTASATGRINIAGALGVTLGDLVCTSAGKLPIAGSVSATLGALSLSAVGGNPATPTDILDPDRTYTAPTVSRIYVAPTVTRIYTS